MISCLNCNKMHKKYEKQRVRIAQLEKKLLQKNSATNICEKKSGKRDFELDKSLLGTSPSQTNFYCF